LPVVSYGCETWFLTLREDDRVRISENRLLWSIFGPKREEAAGCRVKLHNEVTDNLYSSPKIIRVIKPRRMKLTGYSAHIGEVRNMYKILGGKSKGKIPLGRYVCRSEDYINLFSC
jgi:hypothetical protein